MGKKLMKFLWVLVFVPSICVADAITIKDSAPQVYVVKKGDTLWDISSMYLDKPWLWPELWRNNVHITNPHLIYPGDELRLRFNQRGEPVLDIVREPPKAEITLSPQGKMQRKQPAPIPVLPWSVIQPYIDNGSIMSEDEFLGLPYLLGNQDGAVRFASGDVVLSRKLEAPSQSYIVVRKQSVIVDQYENVLGIQLRHIADASPIETDLQDQILVKVLDANLEAKRGDKLLPKLDSSPTGLQLEAAKRQRGQIVDSLEQHQLLGKYDVVILDLGDREVNPGTVMGIYLQGPVIQDSDEPKYDHETSLLRNTFDWADEVQQPAFKVGELVVFKVFEKASYALITRSTKVIKSGAMVAKP